MGRYLVTGGCGFIGSHLVDALLADGHSVLVLDDLSSGARERLAPAADFVMADLRDPAVSRRATAGMDGCFHLAAVASVVRCNEAWHESHLANATATIALFEAAAHGHLPVVYASSAAVYGDSSKVPLREEEPVAPLSPYGIDKAACEMHARAGAALHGMRSVGLRFFNVYGPRQRAGDPYSGVMSIFLARMRRNLPLMLFGGGHQTRDFVFVSDVISALRCAMAVLEAAPSRSCAEVYNVCTGREVAIGELARCLASLAGHKVTLEHGPPRPGDILRSAGSPSRAKEKLGFSATVGIEDGLSHLLAEEFLLES